MDINKIIARAKAILLTPRTEWAVIAAEPETVGGLYSGYIVIMAVWSLSAMGHALANSVLDKITAFSLALGLGITIIFVGFLLTQSGPADRDLSPLR